MAMTGTGRGRVRQHPPWIQTQLDQGYRPYSFYVEYQKTTPLGKTDQSQVSPAPMEVEHVTVEGRLEEGEGVAASEPSPQSGVITEGLVPPPTERNNTRVLQSPHKADGAVMGDLLEPMDNADGSDDANTAQGNTQQHAASKRDDTSMLFRTGDSKPINGSDVEVTVGNMTAVETVQVLPQISGNMTRSDTHIVGMGGRDGANSSNVTMEQVQEVEIFTSGGESDLSLTTITSETGLTMDTSSVDETPDKTSTSPGLTSPLSTNSSMFHSKFLAESSKFGLSTNADIAPTPSPKSLNTVSWLRPTLPWPTIPLMSTSSHVSRDVNLRTSRPSQSPTVTLLSGLTTSVRDDHQVSEASASVDHQVSIDSGKDLDNQQSTTPNTTVGEFMDNVEDTTQSDQDMLDTTVMSSVGDSKSLDTNITIVKSESETTVIPLDVGYQTTNIVTMDTSDTVAMTTEATKSMSTRKQHSKKATTKDSKKRNRNRKRTRTHRQQTTLPPPSVSMAHGLSSTHRYPMYPLPNPSHPQVYFTVPPFTPAAEHSFAKNTTFSIAGLSSGQVTGIAIGCIIAFWIILGPLVCIICKMRDKAKEKRREREQEDSMSHTLIEEMIRMELARGRAKMYRTNIDDEREIERFTLQGDGCNTCSSNGTCVINPQDYVIGNRYNLEYTPVNLTTVPSGEYEKDYNNIINQTYMDSLDTKMFAHDTNL